MKIDKVMGGGGQPNLIERVWTLKRYLGWSSRSGTNEYFSGLFIFRLRLSVCIQRIEVRRVKRVTL
jgi:hypothetical protein